MFSPLTSHFSHHAVLHFFHFLPQNMVQTWHYNTLLNAAPHCYFEHRHYFKFKFVLLQVTIPPFCRPSFEERLLYQREKMLHTLSVHTCSTAGSRFYPLCRSASTRENKTWINHTQGLKLLYSIAISMHQYQIECASSVWGLLVLVFFICNSNTFAVCALICAQMLAFFLDPSSINTRTDITVV